MSLLDYLSQMGGNFTNNMGFTGNQTMSPGIMGLLGAASAFGQANPPQAASRLPLARPSLGYQMSQALGGFGQGYQQGVQSRNQAAALPAIQAQGAGATLGVMQNLQMYNMWAPILGQPTITMQDLQKGNFDKPTMAMAQGAQQQQPQGALQQPQQALPGVASPPPLQGAPQPQPGPMPQGQPPPMVQPTAQPGAIPPQASAQAQISQLPFLVRKKFGFPTSPIEDQAFAAGQDPDSPQVKQLIQTSMLKTAGIDPTLSLRQGGSGWSVDPQATMEQGKPVYNLAAQSPILGTGIQLQNNPSGGAPTASLVPGHIPAMTAVESARETAEQEAQKKVNLGSLYNPGNQNMAGSVPNVSRGTQGNIAAASDKPIPTPSGTLIPPVSQAAPLSDAPAYLEKRIPQWAETENDWAKALPSNYIAEQRGLAIANALKATESGAWATEKSQVAAGLKAVGINLPADILGDPAQVQRALKDNFAQTLATIRQFSSRPAASELILGQKNYSNPNLQPEANLSILSETVGQMRWERALMQDYSQAKRMGWHDPQDFQQAWTQLNPIQKFIDQTKQEIGPLKGMPGFKTPPSDADIKNTAMKYGMTPAQVRQKLGLPNATP